MRSLDRKLLRDLRRLSIQALAVSLVMAAGVATIVLALGAYRSLERTRAAFYERQQFADVFANLSRAPNTLRSTLELLPGVASVDARISKLVLIDVEGMKEPGSAAVIGWRATDAGQLNRVYLRRGRVPDDGRSDEVLVNEAFAESHGFKDGDTFGAIMNGRRHTLRIVGTVLSPGHIYALGPGDLMPDDRRFAIIWMPERVLAGLFNLSGAFNDISMRLATDAQEAEVIRRMDHELRRYGSRGAYGRADHQSNAFIDGELRQLAAMAQVIPPIFLFVSAFLINMILSRLVTLEREQIGLLKAMGYYRHEVALHYIKLILAICAVGTAVGVGAGTWLAEGLTGLYAKFFRFPYLIFQLDVDLFIVAGAITSAAALLGGLNAIRAVLALTPAVAMQPSAPPRYRRILPQMQFPLLVPSRLTVMAFRHMMRWPLKAVMTATGIALAVSVLIVAFFTLDAVEEMIDVSFHQIERQDASIAFGDNKPAHAVLDVARLPGVLRAEPYRSVPVRIRKGHLERKLSLSGKPPDRELSRVLDRDLQPVTLPTTGIVISERLATVLDLRRGDLVDVEVLDGRRLQLRVTIADVIRSYFGLVAYMDLGSLNAILGEGNVISGAHIAYDTTREGELFKRIKTTPAVGSIILQNRSILRFRETLAENINIMTTVYTVLSCIIAFGVVYNSARIQLSERARELATLRVLGLTRGEVGWVLMVELAVLSVVAIPVGWVLGNRFAWLTVQGFTSDLYTVPFIVARATYARATLIVLVAALISVMVVQRRINRLDLVSVLKARD